MNNKNKNDTNNNINSSNPQDIYQIRNKKRKADEFNFESPI